MNVNEMKKEVRRINKEKNLGLKSSEIDAMKADEVRDFLAKHTEEVKVEEPKKENEIGDLFKEAAKQLKAEGKEVKAEIKRISEMYGVTEDDVINMIGGEEVIKADLKMRKAIDIIKEN